MIKIYTFACSRPDFIPLQFRSLQKNLGEPFELIVFNNAAFHWGEADAEEIQKTCDELGIRVIDIEKDAPTIARYQALEDSGPIFDYSGKYSNATVACAYPLCWAWEHIISEEEGLVCIIDSDMFFLRPTRLADHLKDTVMHYLPQARGPHIWYATHGFVLIDMSRLPDKKDVNWWCGKVNGIPVDVGGQTCFYLKDHKDLKTTLIDSYHVETRDDLDFNPVSYDIIRLGGEDILLHYRSGSNWNQKDPEYHEKKTRWLKMMLGENE